MSDNKKTSDSRHRLLSSARRLPAHVEELAAERGPLLRGAFQLRGTRCGKDNCKCARGELHTTAVLVVSEDGSRRSYYLRGPERPEVQRRVERYRRFRQKRIELHRLIAEIETAIDELLEALVEPHRPLRDIQDGERKIRHRGRRKRS